MRSRSPFTRQAPISDVPVNLERAFDAAAQPGRPWAGTHISPPQVRVAVAGSVPFSAGATLRFSYAVREKPAGRLGAR